MSYRNGDFRKYFCNRLKRHIWVLGYFGGGSINFTRFKEVAEAFSKETGIDLKWIYIDEIFQSQRFKGFKYIQAPHICNQYPLEDSEILDDVWDWLND